MKYINRIGPRKNRVHEKTSYNAPCVVTIREAKVPTHHTQSKLAFSTVSKTNEVSPQSGRGVCDKLKLKPMILTWVSRYQKGKTSLLFKPGKI